MEQNQNNPMIDGMKKFIGKTISVIYFVTQDQSLSISGKCVGIDFASKGIIVQQGNTMHLIPRYIIMSMNTEVKPKMVS